MEQSPLPLPEIGSLVSEPTAAYKVSDPALRLAVGLARRQVSSDLAKGWVDRD